LIFIVFAILAIEYEIKPIQRTNLLLIFIAVFLSLFAGMRGVDISRDYAPYLGSFKSIMNGDTGAGILPLFEPGFVAIVLFCYKFFENNPSIAVMMIFAFASVFIKIYAIRKLSFNPFIVVLLYYSHFFFYQEMTQIRNGMACSFFLLAIIFYLNNQKLKVFLLILVALLFHSSALAYFIIFIVRKDSLNKYIYSGLLLFSIVLGFLKIPFLSMIAGFDVNLISNKLATNVELAESGVYDMVRFANWITVFNISITGYLLYYHIVNKIKDPHFTLFLKLNIIAIFSYGLLIGVPSMAARVAELFGISLTFLFAYGIRAFPLKKLNILIVIGIAFVYFYTNLFYGKLLAPYTIIQFR
jgi:hypothetical protein